MPTQDDHITHVMTLALDAPAAPESLANRIEAQCDRAHQLGYRLAAAYPHLDRLVLVFQKY